MRPCLVGQCPGSRLGLGLQVPEAPTATDWAPKMSVDELRLRLRAITCPTSKVFRGVIEGWRRVYDDAADILAVGESEA